MTTDGALSPRQAFEDNVRPADLLLRVYRLLENDTLHTDTQLVHSLRSLVGADSQEELVLVYNEIFLGLVREGAQMPGGTLRRSSFNHLLRQSVVAASTALETYLPSLLRANLPVVIECRGREFVPRDKNLQNYLRDFKFNLDDTLRLIGDPNAPLFIANKLLGFINFKYLAGKQGIHAVGSLLGLEDPWQQISTRLARDRAGLEKSIEDTTRRRNDIVHRADRSQADPGGDAQESVMPGPSRPSTPSPTSASPSMSSSPYAWWSSRKRRSGQEERNDAGQDFTQRAPPRGHEVPQAAGSGRGGPTRR